MIPFFLSSDTTSPNMPILDLTPGFYSTGAGRDLLDGAGPDSFIFQSYQFQEVTE